MNLCRRAFFATVFLVTAAAAAPSGDERSVVPARSITAPHAQAVPARATSIVAVIPFSNITGDAADEWIGAGIAETVMVDLKNVPGLSVIGPEAILDARRRLGSEEPGGPNKDDRDHEDNSPDAVDVAQQLGVTWLVAGGYQRIGDLIRITARFVDVDSGAVIRAVKIEGDVADIFSLQDQIVSRLSDGMELAGGPLVTGGDLAEGVVEAAPGRQGEPVSVEASADRARPPVQAGGGGNESSAEISEGILGPQGLSAQPSSQEDASGGNLTPADVTGGLTIGGKAAQGQGRTGQSGAGGTASPFGRQTVQAVRVSGRPSIDGRLDDAIWQEAAKVTEFVQMNPVEGAAATENTEVYIAYDSGNIYFGFYVHYSDSNLIRAYRADRDRTFEDDLMSVYFDPFLDQQRAYVLTVNGYGVQGDSILNAGRDELGGRRASRRGRGGGGTSGFRPDEFGAPPGDPSWDTLFDSAGDLVEDGWTAELAIPFKSLRYPAKTSGEPHAWGFQIVRSIRSKDETVVWSPISRDISGFLTQLGILQGMTDLSTSRNLELLPTFTAIQFGSLDTDSSTFAQDDVSPEAGLNVKYGVTSDLTADFTYNPDFSQIESDVPQIEVNQRFPLFYPELRPFFLEGQEIFSTRLTDSVFENPVDLVHTRTIVDPRYGGKLTGKAGKTTLGVLVADDEAPGRRDDLDDSALGQTAQVFVGRVRYDMYPQSYIGAIVTDREFMDAYNRVGGVDGRFRLGRTNSLSFMAVASDSQGEDGDESSGPYYNLGFRHSGRNLNYNIFHHAVDPGFRAEAGFVRRTDIRQTTGNVSYRWWPEHWLINWGPRAYYWRHYDFDGVLQDEGISPGLNFQFARNVSASTIFVRHMERYAGIDYHKTSYLVSGNVNTSRRVSLNAFYWGEQIRYGDNPFLGTSRRGTLTAFVRPFSRLQSDLLLGRADPLR